MSAADSAPPDRHPDAETLAAFVDGRLTGTARERMVAHLADCTECHEMLVDVVAVLGDPAVAGATEPQTVIAAAEGAAGTALRPPVSRFRRVLPVAAAVAAAALLAVLVWSGIARWFFAPAPPPTTADLTSPLPVDDALRAATRVVSDYGDAMRGSDTVVSEGGARAFLLGVRNAELQLALAGGHDESAAELTFRIQRLLDDESEISRPIRPLYAPASGEPVRPAEADRRLIEVLGERADWYALGRWVAVARVALQSGHLEWFSEPAPGRGLRTSTAAEWPPEVDHRLDRISALVADGLSQQETPEMDRLLDELVDVATGVRAGRAPR